MVRYLEGFHLFRSKSLNGFVTFLKLCPYIYIYVCVCVCVCVYVCVMVTYYDEIKSGFNSRTARYL